MRPVAAIALFVPLAFAAASPLLSGYWLTLMISVGINALVCVGLVLMAGQAGIASFGQAAFVGVGAYTTALLTTMLQWSPWLSLFASLGMTLVIAFVIGWITVRLSGHYLVLGTIGWSVGFYYALANLPSLGGYDGISGLPQLFLSPGLDERVLFNVLAWLFVAAVLLTTVNLLDSAPGRAIRVVRAKAMAESFGVDTARYKLVVFVFAAASAGLAGWLQAHLLRFVNPSPFNLGASVEYLFMTLIGGVSHVMGAIAGSLFVVVTKSVLQTQVAALLPVTGNYEIVAFGVIVLLILHFAPDGLMALMPARFRPYARLGKPSLGVLASAPKPARGTELLRAESVGKNYGGVRALHDVSLAIAAGEVVALVGPNGAGKSTLFDVLSGLSPLSSGEIWLRGRRIEGRSAREIVSDGLSRTFQHAQLNESMTVLENVSLGGHLRCGSNIFTAALRLDRREEAAVLAEAAEHLAHLGLADLMHEPAGSLALGQQRIVEVARALMADPAIVLLDEPAAGLRFLEKQALAAAIVGMRERGIAVLIVEHDLEFVSQVAERVIVLDFGTRIAEGPVDAVLKDPRVIEAYVGRPRNAA